jgi:hypothetical protein
MSSNGIKEVYTESQQLIKLPFQLVGRLNSDLEDIKKLWCESVDIVWDPHANAYRHIATPSQLQKMFFSSK